MKAEELKNYLRFRGLKVTGKITCCQSFLCFLCFLCFKTVEQVEFDLKQEDDKLKLNKMNIPNPFKLNNGWLDEEEQPTGLLYQSIALYNS